MSNSETDIIKIFIKESEMVNNRKLQLMYLMISIRISGIFISGIVRRTSNAVTTFVGPELVRLPTMEREVQELTDRYLEAHDFPQYIGAIDGTNIEIAEPSQY